MKSLQPKGSLGPRAPDGLSLSCISERICSPGVLMHTFIDQNTLKPWLISSPCFSVCLSRSEENIICGFPNLILQTGIHLVVFSPRVQLLLCFLFVQSPRVPWFTSRAEKYNNIWNTNRPNRQQLWAERSKDLLPPMPRLPFGNLWKFHACRYREWTN